MVVKKIPLAPRKFIGVSTDTKPSGAEVPIGSTFFEHDTQTMYITHDDGSTWVLKEPYGEVKAAPTSNTILGRLRALLTGIVLAAGSAVIGKVGHDVTTIGDGRKEVAAAGTRVALAASTPAKLVIITAETDNTGVVVVGGSTVVATVLTRRGMPLSAGASTPPLEVDNLADISIDATVSGDGVTYIYLN